MSGNVKLWCFILLLPFFAVIGHDFYFNYMATDVQKARLEAFEIDPKSYQNSDFGYILVKYTPEQYQMAKDMTDLVVWEKWVDPVLRLYTFIIALIPALLYFLWLLISRIFDMGPFTGSMPVQKNAARGYEPGARGTQFKYKRK